MDEMTLDEFQEMVGAKGITDFVDRNYRSKSERRYASDGALYVGSLLNCPVKLTEYEPITFNLPGGKYTPDFMHLLEDGQVVFVEVKGSKRQKNYRDARSKLRAAAYLFPMFTFIEAIADEFTWNFEVIRRRAGGRGVY